MSDTITTLTAAPAGADAVCARFLRVGDEILVNGAIFRVVTDPSVHASNCYVSCVDTAGRDIAFGALPDTMVELYDRVAANEAIADAYARMFPA